MDNRHQQERHQQERHQQERHQQERHQQERKAMIEQDHQLGTPEMLVLFRVGLLRLGIDVRTVSEVTRAVPISAPLPNAGCVIGMITLRGQSTAVVDLNVVLGIPCEHRDRRARMIVVRHDGAAVCLLVDQIDGLREVTAADLEPPPPVVADVDIRWLDYITGPATGDVIGVVNSDRILSQACLAETEVAPASV